MAVGRHRGHQQPLHLQELTFKVKLPLSPVFVSCTLRCGLSERRCRWSGDDPMRSLTLPLGIECWLLTTLREKLVKISAKI
jgi:hypothetical protein